MNKKEILFFKEINMRIAICLSLWILIFPISLSFAQETSHQGDNHRRTVSDSACVKNLSHLEAEMEALLKSVYVKEFRKVMRRSLKASIPDVVSRIDGLKDEIASLQKEITHQVRVEKSAEFILRDITKVSDGPFKPCRRTEKGGYCETLERFYMAKAANLANRGFLEALECHLENGRN
jgi:hypothetical protein